MSYCQRPSITPMHSHGGFPIGVDSVIASHGLSNAVARVGGLIVQRLGSRNLPITS